MRRIALPLGLFVAALLASAPAHAGPIKDTCMGVDPRLGGPCRGVEVFAAEGSTLCRYAGAVPEERCATPVTPRVSHAAIAAYKESWLHRTLAFQHDLGNTLPLVNAHWVGTHNSYNSASETYTVSGMDSNQQVTLADQLDMDVRSLEIDAHYVPSPWAGGAKAPVACHGRGEDQLHAGCTSERLLAHRLREIAGWLDDHPGQVILLYLEDHLETLQGHDEGAAVVRAELGDRVYAPGTADCTQMPLGLTRAHVLAAGAQVVVLGSCGQGAAWHAIAYGDTERAANESGSDPFSPYPGCDPARDQAFFDDHFIRYYEDSTGLSAGVAFSEGQAPGEGITPARAAAMIRCGVDLTGFDQLLPDDGRLAALAWSWAEDEPAAGAGDCAIQAADARWYAEPCTERHAFACQASDGSWWVDLHRVKYKWNEYRCRRDAFAIPRRGVEAQRLADAMAEAGVADVWIALRPAQTRRLRRR